MTKDELIIQRIEDLKDNTDRRLDSIDKNLADHMEQTMLVREQNAEIRIQNKEIVKQTTMLAELHRDNQNRIEDLEKPKNARAYLRDILIYIGAAAGAVLTIAKLIEHL